MLFLLVFYMDLIFVCFVVLNVTRCVKSGRVLFLLVFIMNLMFVVVFVMLKVTRCFKRGHLLIVLIFMDLNFCCVCICYVYGIFTGPQLGCSTTNGTSQYKTTKWRVYTYISTYIYVIRPLLDTCSSHFLSILFYYISAYISTRPLPDPFQCCSTI